jgi:predicted enzyme related to lactoylglutathione lyase
MSEKQGTFVWYELLTADVKKAIDFYGNVIGWGTQAFGESYNMWTAG